MSTGSLLFLTMPDAEHGFALAGFRQQRVAMAEAETALLAILDEGGPYLVVVDERLLPGIDPERFAEMGRRYGGALAVLPCPGLADGAPDYAGQLIARTVGYQPRIAADEER